MGIELTDDTIAAAQAGDPAAQERVYQTLSPGVLGYFTARGAADPDASTSEAFLTLFRRLPTLRGGARGVRTFLYSVAHARLVDEYRSRRRMPASVPFDSELDQRRAPSAEDLALRQISDQHVAASLASLPEDQAEVLTLRIVADLSLAQTAMVMGRSEGAIKQLQRRALLALRARLADRPVTR